MLKGEKLLKTDTCFLYWLLSCRQCLMMVFGVLCWLKVSLCLHYLAHFGNSGNLVVENLWTVCFRGINLNFYDSFWTWRKIQSHIYKTVVTRTLFLNVYISSLKHTLGHDIKNCEGHFSFFIAESIRYRVHQVIKK